jgi:hypothetical protein
MVYISADLEQSRRIGRSSGRTGMAEQGDNKQSQTAAIRYVDQPDMAETFADSINNVYFDGQSLRIEFGITRLDEVKPNTPVTGRHYPAERLVLTPAAAAELINRMQQVGAALTQAGVLKPANPPAAAASTSAATTPASKTAN